MGAPPQIDSETFLYDGTSNWEDYLIQFEMIAYMNDLDDSRKAMEVAVALREPAQGILSNVLATERKDY